VDGESPGGSTGVRELLVRPNAYLIDNLTLFANQALGRPVRAATINVPQEQLTV